VSSEKLAAAPKTLAGSFEMLAMGSKMYAAYYEM
jgi:hypothetical protein